MKLGLSYDDVLLEPKGSPVESRSEVDTSTELAGIELDVPVMSAPMKSVTELSMSLVMSYMGGCGIVHRFQRPVEQASQVSKVDGVVGAAVGLSDERDDFLVDMADFLCVDVAHGHLHQVIERVEQLDDRYDIPIMAGAIATRRAAIDLRNAGADILRVGVGPGSACTTREVAGVGVPQITAIQDVVPVKGVDVVADGGISSSGDIVKALMAGADAVIIGGLLAACEESPAEVVNMGGIDYKVYQGMASKEVQEDLGKDEIYVEGESYTTELYGSAEHRMEQFKKGIQSGLSYCGGCSIGGARRASQFIRVTPNGASRAGAFGKIRYD